MKIKDSFIISEVGGDIVLVPVESDGFKGIVRINKTSKFIIECLRLDTTKDAILDRLKEKYFGDEKEMAESIDIVLNTLRKVNALVE